MAGLRRLARFALQENAVLFTLRRRWTPTSSQSTLFRYHTLIDVTNTSVHVDRAANGTIVPLRYTGNSLSRVKCWECGRDLADQSMFCDDCGVIQPANTERSHFDVLGAEVKFDLDTQTLRNKFRSLQWKLHPDKFANKSNTEKEYSAQQSTRVNNAFNSLLKPLPRGLYMLELHGSSLEESEIQFDAEFLMDIMETNENLDSATSLDTIEEIGEKNKIILDELIQEVAASFEQNDIEAARRILAKLKYYANIDDKVTMYEEKLMAKS